MAETPTQTWSMWVQSFLTGLLPSLNTVLTVLVTAGVAGTGVFACTRQPAAPVAAVAPKPVAVQTISVPVPSKACESADARLVAMEAVVAAILKEAQDARVERERRRLVARKAPSKASAGINLFAPAK